MLQNYFHKLKFDTYITILTFTILIFGFAVFFSASLGVLARYEAKFYGIVQNQLFFGILVGTIAYFTGSFVSNKFIKNISPFIFLLAIFLCILVFVPGVGFAHGGASRWIQIFGFTMQPSEILKYSSILFLSAFYSHFHLQFENYKYRVVPVVSVAMSVLLVLKEPDLGTSTIIFAGIFSVFFIVNAKIRDLLILLCLTIPMIFGFYMFYPHASERVNTFLFPDKNSADQNYQVKQTKISLGAGGIFGDGYGQSTQKFHHLPEPVGDSIFAVIGEEFGYVGALLVLLTIMALAFRLIYLSHDIRDPWSKGVLCGTGVVLLVQTFLNAGSSSGAIPFTGVPLPLISHGSTSIIITMYMLGLCAQLASKKYLH